MAQEWSLTRWPRTEASNKRRQGERSDYTCNYSDCICNLLSFCH